jgi:hypothetical protein
MILNRLFHYNLYSQLNQAYPKQNWIINCHSCKLKNHDTEIKGSLIHFCSPFNGLLP